MEIQTKKCENISHAKKKILLRSRQKLKTFSLFRFQKNKIPTKNAFQNFKIVCKFKNKINEYVLFFFAGFNFSTEREKKKGINN